MKECNKCDERGMIADLKIKGAASSCKCGKHNRYMQEIFNEKFGGDPVSQIDNLIAYGLKRREEKSNLI